MQPTAEEQGSLPHYLEYHLGTIERGWRDDAAHSGIQIVSFANQPEVGVTTFATLGLSRSVLKLNEARTIRQELITSVSATTSPDAVAGFLLSIAGICRKINRRCCGERF